jgi:hypothetical protein
MFQIVDIDPRMISQFIVYLRFQSIERLCAETPAGHVVKGFISHEFPDSIIDVAACRLIICKFDRLLYFL